MQISYTTLNFPPRVNKTLENKNQQIVILAENLRSNVSAVTYLRKSFKAEESSKRDLQKNLGNKTREETNCQNDVTQLKVDLRQSVFYVYFYVD
jgi:chromosome segregation ATPase